MLRTEDEAKKCWCPFARELVGQMSLRGSPVELVASFNRSGAFAIEEPKCIASACMAWRWKVETPAAIVGWCGLSGRP